MSTVYKLAKMVGALGGTTYFVGGTVRDALLGRKIKDVDVEVFGVEQKTLEAILATFGEVNLVGKSFGVYKVGDLDVALPRTEVKTGDGHKGFTVVPDPLLPVVEAMRRRDFTMNAVYQNVLTAEVVDHFGGVQDIQNKVIRVVDEVTFRDDSLRVLRAAQFASRLGFTVVDAEFMRTVDLTDLPAERVFGELEKLLLGANVRNGLETLDAVGAVAQLFPELDVLRNVEQDAVWHPEGDVWTHTLMVMAVSNGITENLPKAEKLTVMLACLLHDLGKAVTTERCGDRVKAHGHSEAGVPLAENVLDRLNVFTVDGFDVRTNVLQLVEKHLLPAQLHNMNKGEGVKDSVFRRLSTKVNVKLLAYVCKADVLGRGGEVDADCVDWFNERINRLDIVDKVIEPILKGRHLIEMGMKPSKEFGVILDAVFEKQLDGAVTNLGEALAQVGV